MSFTFMGIAAKDVQIDKPIGCSAIDIRRKVVRHLGRALDTIRVYENQLGVLPCSCELNHSGKRQTTWLVGKIGLLVD